MTDGNNDLKNRAPWKANMCLPVSVFTEGNTRLELFSLGSFSYLCHLNYSLNCSDERPLNHLKMSIATLCCTRPLSYPNSQVAHGGLRFLPLCFG